MVGRRRLPSGRDIALLAVAGLFGVFLNQALFLAGLSRTTVSRSALICSQIPTFVLLFAVISRQERLTLGNAASYGLYVVISHRVMARNDPLAVTAVVFFWGTLGMMFYGGDDILATDFSRLTPDLWGAMAYVILGATVTTYLLNSWAVKRITATRVAVFIFLQPLVATVLGMVFRDEAITPRFVVAAAFVLTALMLRDSDPVSESS